MTIHDVSHTSARQPSAPEVQEESVACRLPSFGLSRPGPDPFPSDLKVRFQGFRSAPAEWNDALLPAFSHAPHQTFAETDVAQVQSDQLAGTKAGGIQKLQNRPVALAQV